MRERLMGVETEYAFLAFLKDGSPANARLAMGRIERLAEQHLPHLPAHGQRGIFLQNASRFYRDFGGGDAHQEMTTPECANPWDAVRYIVANEQILVDLAGRLLQEDRALGEAVYFKHNVDYSGAHTSWGLHESYLTRTPINELPPHLVPHLVSRLVFTGAGGFDPFAPGLEFMVSPRVAHLSQVTALDTERSRPIFNLRDESLSNNGFRRMHIICGESLSSHTGMWLRSATTALVVALADGSVKPGHAVELADPLAAMRAFARDPTCRTRALMVRGAAATAMEIQRHYLRQAEAHLEADFMPPWAAQVCHHWRDILDRLERGAPESVATTLDWAIKYSLFSHALRQRGLGWSRLPRGQNPAPRETARQQLFEMDIRYGQLGQRGIFASLERAGALRHQFPGVDNFPHAMVNPPNVGRALLRGNAIRHICERRQQGFCDWTGVWNMSERKFLDLSPPFESVEKWRELPSPEWAAHLPEERDQVLARIERQYHEGRFEQAETGLRALQPALASIPQPQLTRLLRLRALLHARRGQLDALALLESVRGPHYLGLDKLCDQLFVLRLTALAPQLEIEGFFRGVVQHCGAENVALLPPRVLEHLGAYRVSCGRATEGKSLLEIAAGGIETSSPAHARCLTELANTKRLLGECDPACALLERAGVEQRERGFLGDLADFTLPNLAKARFASDPTGAWRLLLEAKAMQSRNRDRLGLVRTLLLDARLAAKGDRPRHSNEAIVALSQEVPSLRTCLLFKKIMENWDAWSHDLQVVENGDIFWGL